MDLMGVPQFVRNADRFRHVIAVLAKHGLADWLSAIPMPWLDSVFRVKATETLTTEQRIRVALTELGTTFIKLGQVLSTRPDLVGTKLADELAHLQADTPSDDPAVAVALIETELGANIAALYASFEANALLPHQSGKSIERQLTRGNPWL